MPELTTAHHTAGQRFEAKYLITDVQHALIEDYVRTFTRADEHSAAYPVTSVYFDDEQWSTFRSSYFGEKNRFKLRVRAYDSEGSLFSCEVKRRTGQIVRKSRALIRRSGLLHVASGEPVLSSDFVTPGDVTGLIALNEFMRLRDSIRARPRVAVRYRREAHVSVFDEPVRITFDRFIETCRADVPLDRFYDASGVLWRRLPLPTVLEIKFTNRFPDWVHRMIQRFELERISLAKYVVAVQNLADDGLIAGIEREELPPWAN